MSDTTLYDTSKCIAEEVRPCERYHVYDYQREVNQ